MRLSGDTETTAEGRGRHTRFGPRLVARTDDRGSGGLRIRAADFLVVCTAVVAVTTGCSAPDPDGLRLASTSGDFAIGSATPGDRGAGGGFLGGGIEGASGPAAFADGSAATVILGPKYFAASGRWCRHYRRLGADGLPAATASSEVACLAANGWHRARPVVVTRFGDTSRS